ncbi:hypothetical protein BS78_08G136500 [Paspalum vaginatum]|nr:hypothetical protein BS78_08G136500 [Paspalum vaginatum]
MNRPSAIELREAAASFPMCDWSAPPQWSWGCGCCDALWSGCRRADQCRYTHLTTIMAAVPDAFAPYVKKLIADMAQEEVSMLLGVSSDITKLEDNMEGLKSFLADSERRHLTNKSVQRWVRKLKDAMYDATDIIDLCQLEVERRKKSGGDGNDQNNVPSVCFQSLIFCLQNPVFAHKIGSSIKELNQRLEAIHKEANRFKFNIGFGSNLERPRKPTAPERSSQKMASEFDESAIVGVKIEIDTKDLSHLLIGSGDHKLKVVSIVGTGGIGKTTLAQKIFHNTTMQEHFKLKVWLSITQHFDKAELLRAAIKHARAKHGREEDKALLVRILTDALSLGRFLLVLDDVWTLEAWRSNVLSIPIKKASQKQPTGNWVITTRSGDLAQQMGASFCQHHVSLLDQEDAWSLLNKQLPPPNNRVNYTYLHLKCSTN